MCVFLLGVDRVIAMEGQGLVSSGNMICILVFSFHNRLSTDYTLNRAVIKGPNLSVFFHKK